MHITPVNGNWWRVFKLVIPYFVIVGGLQIAAIYLLGLHFDDLGGRLTAHQTLVVMLFTAAGTFLVVWLFRKYVDRGTFASMGFEEFRVWDLLWGILIGGVIMALGYLILVESGEITYLNSSFVPIEIFVNILFCVLVAFSEELLMRGYILTNLMGSMNRYQALAVSSCLFSVMHMGNADYGWFAAIELFFAGLLLGLSFIYTRNLWFPIALHFSWNFFQGPVFGFNVSGRHLTSVINHVRMHDNIWNGGAFGFEGSLLSLMFQVVGITLIYFLFRKREPSQSADHLQ